MWIEIHHKASETAEAERLLAEVQGMSGVHYASLTWAVKDNEARADLTLSETAELAYRVAMALKEDERIAWERYSRLLRTLQSVRELGGNPAELYPRKD
ncbi:hypothetical protein PBI_DUMBO_141 [Mycobacterium phage Dumbo]|uniref:hypothetical protein n=1 Tax=Mycobacterium phage Dumbo TaxID=1327764 RepID=UPI000332B0A1|nr:hypothetical protein PBI_DUMBO_141 [Mycobacterium phage Dumbo]AGM12880.1 hypothetical protein PBI_DUMBO_141 [Mycobacterium phage Dumbo]